MVKEFDNVLIPNEEHGILYNQEAYVIRWAFTITVVRDLEGLTPGRGPFARDRQYQKDKVGIIHYDVMGGKGEH